MMVYVNIQFVNIYSFKLNRISKSKVNEQFPFISNEQFGVDFTYTEYEFKKIIHFIATIFCVATLFVRHPYTIATM